MNKLHFELYNYGDPYLKVELDGNQRGYCIEQADKFELGYYDTHPNGKNSYTKLGLYDNIYDALDAANYHYDKLFHDSIVECGQLTVYNENN